MRMRLLVVAAVAASALAIPAAATVVLVPELPELAQKSDVIVHAVVTDQQVREEDGHVLTETTLLVSDPLKGAKANETLRIVQIGGTLNNRVSWIAGAHRFKKGEEMVLFAARWSKHGPDAIIPFGVGYGVFDIVEQPSGELQVLERIGDIESVKRDAKGHLVANPRTPRTWVSLSAFKDEIRGLLAAPAPQSTRAWQPPQRLRVGGAR
jgi:hypothetical protein